MRSFYPLVAAACLLAAPLPSAAQCGGGGMVNLVVQRDAVGGPANFVSTGTQLMAEVQGIYLLSNGHRLHLSGLEPRLVARFDDSRRVYLDEVGPHRFASRQGDVQLTWMPEGRVDTILLSYPADSKGRLRRGCS